MELTVLDVPAIGKKIVHLDENGKELGRAFLYILKNDLHAEPFGFMEDVYVDDAHQGKGIGKAVLLRLIEEARLAGCYKIVATSRYARTYVHDIYLKLGFKDQGKEFRYDFTA